MSEKWTLSRIHKMRDRIEYGAQTDEALDIIEAVLSDEGNKGADITHSETNHNAYIDHKWTILWRKWKPKPCPTCGGSGKKRDPHETSYMGCPAMVICPACHGTGVANDTSLEG